MSSSTDPDHFFQTNHSLAEIERKSLKSKNKNGNPIRLPSKILAVIADPQRPYEAVFVAESAGNVRRVAVDVEVIVSGAADASIIVWNAESAERLHVLKGHTRGILDLAIDPASYIPTNLAAAGLPDAVLFSAGSDREIRRWRVSLEKAEQLDPENPLLVHETSVYALRFDEDGDLWTASADGTAKCLSRFQNFQADSTFQHGDYVRAVAPEETGGYVVTAGRSEDVKVWDRGSGDLIKTFDGHYEEVSGLVMLHQRCVSVSIDGTIRLWSLALGDLGKASGQNNSASEKLEVGDEVSDVRQSGEGAQAGLTEEEERELDELMNDDD
ncbi:MAG: hypothetical protein Q9168_005115 [Polycauliona sp. 1 TL-2023]